MLETPTWRANPDWAARQGYPAAGLDAANRDAVDLVIEARARWEQPGVPVVVSGCIGPRGDGYHPDSIMTAEEAQAYHAVQIETFADTEADLVTAITMTYADEAIGITRAAQAEDLPVVISFTAETDGRLPTGETLGEAIEAVDAATGRGRRTTWSTAHTRPTSSMRWSPMPRGRSGSAVSAPTPPGSVTPSSTRPRNWTPATRASWRRTTWTWRRSCRKLAVLGGCCGTTHEHVSAISRAFAAR